MKRLSLVVVAAALLVSAAAFAASQSRSASGAAHSHAAAAAKTGAWKGEILDAGCYLDHGAMGEKHKECALKCAANGMPLMMLVGGKAVLLTPDHENGDPYNSLKDMAGSVVEVTGKMFTRSGATGIEVHGAKLAVAAK